MKINKLLLKNFIGIKHGLGLDEVEIDFTKGKNKIVMLRGGNGSGKSTILSQLHPYKESFDERKDLILEGQEGRKEIEIEHNGDIYKIVHIYAKSAQSFISKNGEELNESGGVRTFEDIVHRELGVTKEYFKIGKIGSNTKNFVDFTAADRKSYIGTFLDIESILEKYKVANDKLKLLKKDIQSVGNDLKKFQPKDVLETEISNINLSISEIDEKLQELYSERGSLQTSISRDASDIGTKDIQTLKNRVLEKENEHNTAAATKATLGPQLEHKDDAINFSTILTDEISSLQKEIHGNDIKKQNAVLLINDCKNKISSTKIELEALGNPEDIEKLNNEITELNNQLEAIKTKIKENPQAPMVNNLIKSKKDISRLTLKFTDFMDFIEKYFTNLSEKSMNNTTLNIENFFDDTFKDSLARQIKEARRVLDEKQKLLEEQKRNRSVQETFVCQLENLNKRPSACNIDNCPFIKEALLHKNVLSEITECEGEIQQTKADLELLTIKAENLQILDNLYTEFLSYYNSVGFRDNEIYTTFIKEKSLIEYVSGSLADFQTSRQNYIEEIETAISDINTFLSITNRVRSAQDSKKVLEDSDSTVREKYEKDIQENTARLETLERDFDTLKSAGEVMAKTLTAKQDLLNKYTDYTNADSKFNSSATMLSNARIELQKISELIDSKSKAELRLSEVNGEINSLTLLKNSKNDDLTRLNTALSQSVLLNQKLENLKAQYAPVETVAAALNPTTGIPLVLIQTYLGKTEEIANELLDIAFSGEFAIKFITTEKEFSIQVKSKDNIKPDIKMASQGEIAITTISLSLALIEQSIGEYNILCLDEIDGPLDPNNRGNFIDILENQITKLGIEQVFVISHNDAFDTASTDLVLLRDNNVDTSNESFMKNKTIIFESEGV